MADKTMIRRALGPVTEIQDFDMARFDGVDHGANLTDGWLVIKSADGDDPAVIPLSDIVKAEEDWISKADELVERLAEFDWQSAPANIQTAVEVIKSFLNPEDEEVEKSSGGLLQWVMEKVGLSKAKSEDDLDAEAIEAEMPAFCADIAKALSETPRELDPMLKAVSQCVSGFSNRVMTRRGIGN